VFRTCICFPATTLLLLLLGTKAAGALPSSEFRPHDSWSVIGDSITQYGSYYAWIYLYQVTRFPEAEFSVANCGISGDSAGGAVKRYDWDIKSTRPTVATIMLGMNDVSRELYADRPATAEILGRRENALANYRRNLKQLVGLLRQDEVRLIFVTPSPFDETADVDFPRLPGVNQALVECGKFMRTLAEKNGAALVDLNGQMTELNGRLQRKNPKFTLIGPDRVHPGIPGHFVMAYFFLHAQKAPAIVSRLAVNIGNHAVTAENASIEALTIQDGVIQFKCLERALPYPVPAGARPALEWVAFQAEFNQEILQFSGLRAGNYTLFIDGERIADFAAESLGSGINLADLPTTPQLRQAREVLKLVQEWQQLVASSQRGIAEVEHWKLPQVAHPIGFDAAKPLLLKKLEELKVNPGQHPDLDRDNIQRYLAEKPQETAMLNRLRELRIRIRDVARPATHVFRLAPLVSSGS